MTIAGDHALFSLQRSLDPRFREPVQHLDDDAALFLVGHGRDRAVGGEIFSGEIFSNVKAGMVYPLFVELKHSWSLPDILS